MKTKIKKKNKKKISKVLLGKVARVASLATTVVAGEMVASSKAEASITIGSTSGSSVTPTGASLIGSGNTEGIAIGKSSKVSGAYGIAVGKDSTSVQEGAIAIGKDSNALNKSAVALGYNSKASGGQSVAIGGNIQTDRGAQATGDQSISIGGDTVASGASSIAIGGDDLNGVASTTAVGRLFNKLTGDTITFNHFQQTTASGGASIAVGVQSTSKGDLATAFGTRTTATGGYSTALGVGASSIGQGSIALGGAANATGDTSIAIGTKVTTIGESASAIGYGSQANNKGSIAIGLNSKSGTVGSTEENTIAMGTNSQSLTANSVAIGTGSIGGSTGIGSSAVAIGNGASAKGSDGIALGSGSNANNMQNIAIGYKTETGKTQVAGSSNNTDIRNVSIGSEAGKGMGGKDNLFLGTSSGQTSNGDYNVAFGSGSGKSVTGSYNTAMGANAGIGVKNNNNVSIGADSGQNTDGLGNTAIGWQSGQAVKGGQNISMGYQSAKGLKGNSNTVIGNQAGIGGVEGDNNIIVGTNATRLYTTGGSLKVKNVVSLGTNSKAYTDNSMSIGSYSEATGKAAIAIGQGSKASKDNSMAIGNGTLANTANGDVALGSGSATKAVTAVSNVTITPPSSKSITYGTFAGNNPQSAVSVGSAGNERQIQNVAAGRVTATSTDAINGSQLFAVANELGKTWKANAGGNLSGSATSTQVMPGDEVQFVAGKNLEVEQNLATGSQKYTYSLKKDVDLGPTGSLKAGPVTINNNGIDAGNKKITNVAPGTADTDAANVSQVKAATTTVSSNDASVTVNKVQKSDGHYNYDLSVDTNKIAANTNLTYKANSGTGLTTTLANGLDFKDGDNTVATVGPNGEVKYSLNPTVAGINSITTNGGNTVINDNGITTPKVTINNAPTAGTDATNKDYVDSTKTKVTSNDSSVVVNKTTSGNQDIYDLSVDVTKLDAANKSLSNINNAGKGVISDIARNSVDVIAGTNIKDVTKANTTNPDGTTKTTYTINANGARVVAGDGVTVATGTPGSNNITDYTVSVKNTTLTAAPGSTTVTAGDNNSYAKAGDVATAITKVGAASKTELQNGTNTNVTSHQGTAGQTIYQVNADKSEVAVTGTGLSLDSKTTTDSNGTKTTKYTLGLDTTQLTTTGGKVDAPTDPGKVVTAGDIATAINSAGWNVVAGNTGTGTTSGNVANKLITPGETVKLQAGDNLNVDQSGGIFTYSLKKDISLDSVTTGDTKVANGGITITNPSGNPVTLGPSGLNNGGNTITGVGNAVNDDDAVNLGQLKAVKNNPLKFGGDSGTVVTRKLGDQLDIKGGATGATTSGNIAVIADGNNTLNIQLAKNLTGLDSISTNGGNTVINDSGITTPKVTINNAPTVGTDATNKDYVDSTKTKVTSNDSSVVINKTTSGNQDVYDLSVDVTKLDAANKSLSNINNAGKGVISDIARNSVDVIAGTNIKDVTKANTTNPDGTTKTTYTINANGARVVAGDGVTVATGTPGSNNITDYTVSVKNTTLTATPGSTTVTAGDNNSYAKAGDVATAITNVGKASKTTVTSNDSSVTVVSKVDSGDGHVNYDLSVDTSKVAANTNLTYKANSGTGLTTTLANGLDFKDGDNTKATVGPNGEVKYSLNPTVAGINSITTNGGNTVINDNGVTTPSLTLTNSTPLTSSTGGKVTVPAGTGNQAVTGQTVANAINKLGDNTINLKASDGNITTKQSLNKDGGLEFNITGSNGITTTASGDTINVTIAQSGLTTSTAGGKTAVTPVTGGNTYATAGDVATAIQNAVNNSGWNAVAGSTGTGTTSGSVSNKLITPGETVKLQAGDNLNVDQSGGTFTYSLKKDISLDSVTTGDTKVANGGITIGTGSNQVSLTNNGLNNGGNKITNVAAGTNKNDAVNVGQLNAAKTELENGTNTTVSSRTGSNGQTIYKVNTDFTSIADAIGGNTKFDPTTGKIDTSAANIGGTGQTNISDAVKAAITTVSSNDASVTVNKVQKSDGHYNYDLSVDTNKIAANTNLTYKANSGTGLTTTLANGLDFKDGDNTKATVGPNGEVKYSLNPTVAGINSITTNGGNTVINDNGVTTPSLTLTNSTPLTSSTGGKVTVPAGTGNQAVTGQTVANAINKLGDNTINLKASDGNITTKQSLNKDGGLEFNITGSNGITTTASGDTINVTIAQSGLTTSTAGGKTAVTPVTGGNTYATAGDVATAIQNAVNNSGWNAVAGSTGTGTTSGSVSNKLITPGETVKLQAGDNLNVDQSGGTFTYSLKNDINVNSITAGNNKFDTSGLTISDAAGNKAITTPSGTTYTNAAGNTTVINPTGVVINKSAADPSKSVSLTDNGLDNGGNKITNVAAGVNPTDAVNVSQLKNAVNNATYNGPVVYTNAAGEKIVKANNGNYYKALDVDSDGNPLPGKLPVSSSDIQHSLLNADGSTTNPSTLDNVGKGKISSSSKQAINGSQLNNLGTQLGLTVDPSGTGFSNPTFAGLKNVNGSTGAAPTTFKDAVDQTIDKVNEGIIYGADNNTAGTRQQLGSRLTVESGDFASGGVNYKGQNLETSYVSDGAGNGKIIVGITENPEFNSVKAKTFTADDGAGNTTVTNGQGTTITDAAGNKNVATAAGNTYTNAAGNTTTVNSSGVTINKSAADPSKSVSLTNSGLDNGGNRITNIAAGVAPTDAVNVSQLGNAVNNLTTAINASKSEVVGGTNTNVTSSTGSNGQIVYKVDADGTTVSGGSSFVSVTQGTKDANNITDYKVDLAQGTKDKLNSIGTGNIAAGDNNTVTGSTVHNYIQNNPLTYTDDNGTTVTRNLGQNLNIMGRATGPLTTGNIGVVAAGPDTLELRLAENVDLGPNGRVTMGKTVVNDDGIKITGGPSVTSSGIDAGGKKVTNIAEGDISPTSNDAVTGRQIYNAISAGAADKATRAELAGVNNNLTAGIAGVAAMANLPQINDSASNRFNIAVAGGAYKNGRAMALGFSGVSDGGRFVYRASASLNNKRDVAVGLGVGYQFGKRDVMPNELDRMKSMVALIEEQKDSYSRQLKQQLEQESRKNQENSELIRQLMQEVQELKNKSKKG